MNLVVECILAPLDGHWGRWSEWSSCSVTCDTGTYKRTRKCDDPEPKNNGKDCEGQSQEVGQCVMQRCGLGKTVGFVVVVI